MAPIFVGLLVGSALPVIKICLISCIGAILAHQKILKPPTRQALSQLLFFVFMPCLVFSKLSPAVDVKNLSTWWPLPANVLMSIVLGLAVGYATSLLVRVPKYLRLHISCAIAFGNVGNLPLVMVGTLCRDPRLPFSQSIGSECEAVGTAYIVFAFWIASIVQSCLVYNLFRLAPSQPSGAAKQESSLPHSPFAARSLQAGTFKEGNGVHPGRSAGSKTDGDFDFGKEVARISQDLPAEWTNQDTPTRQALLQKLNSLAFRASFEVCDNAQMRLKPFRQLQQQFPHDSSAPVKNKPARRQPSSHASPADSGQDQSRSVNDSSSKGLVNDRVQQGRMNGHHESAGPASKGNASGQADVEMQPVSQEAPSQPENDGPNTPGIAFDNTDFIVPVEGDTSLPHPAEGSLEDADPLQPLGDSSSEERQQLLSRHAASDTWNGNGRLEHSLPNEQGAFHRWRHRTSVLMAAIPWQHILNMPTCSAVLGLVVGCLTPVKELLYSPQSPIMVVEEGIAMLAGAALPCMLLVLGAILCKGPGQSQLRMHEIVGVVIAKLIVMPLAGAVVILSVRSLGAFTEPDPLFLFLMLLVQASPTAINIQTMATLCKSGEAEVSTLLFWEYICSIFTIPAFILLFLRLI